MTKVEWINHRYDIGEKYLRLDDPFWREHFMADLIRADLEAGRPVPVSALLIDNSPLTAKEIERGKQLWEKNKHKFEH